VHRWSRTFAALAVLALLAAGCSNGDGEGDFEPTSRETARLEAITLTDLEVGSAPRFPITADLTEPQAAERTLAFNLSINEVDAAIGGPSQLIVSPAEDDGRAPASGIVGPLDLTVDGGTRADAREAVTYDMDFQVTPDRVVSDSNNTVEIAPEVEEIASVIGDVDAAFPYFLFPVPDEPIGPGAAWRLEGEITLFGLRFDLDADVSVESVNRQAYALDYVIELAAPSSRLSGTGAVRGVPSEVVPLGANLNLRGGGQVIELLLTERPQAG
jgi:hypothetical protein